MLPDLSVVIPIRNESPNLRKRFSPRHVERVMGIYEKYGVLAVIVPALLPPPTPFKLFVLLAGVSGVRPVPFAVSIAAGRGFRYLAIGLLSVWYGARAVTFLQEHGTQAAIVVAVLMAAALAIWFVVRQRQRRQPALTSAG